MRTIQLADYEVGPGRPLLLIAGPDVIESEASALRHAHALRELCARLRVPLIFKASFDKANRTSGTAFRGPGVEEGMRVLAAVKAAVKVPVLTDVHETAQVPAVAAVADVLQIPAFLSRQTDLIVAAAKSGRGIHLKKGQFIAPQDIARQAEKAFAAGNPHVLVTERGASFGYRNLVVDMRGLAVMRAAGLVVGFDATHSVQLPSGEGDASGGERSMIPVLARAAAAAGIDALFLEVHESPDDAPCDGACALDLTHTEALLTEVLAVRRALGHER